MKKLILDSLVFEITRRCNMKPICAHCFRGMPQNKDLSIKPIDNILNQIEELGDIKITGGEPMLNLPAIRHIIDKVIEKRITLTRFILTTNALICPDEFIDMMKDIDAYIHSQSVEISVYDGVYVFFSVDKYHDNNEGIDFAEKCKQAFDGTSIKVLEEMSGGIPVPVGNGKTLQEASEYNMFHTNVNQIEYRYKDHKPVCWGLSDDPQRYAEILDSPSYAIHPLILCPLYLNADGILHTVAANHEYKIADQLEAICDMNRNPDIFDSILKFNAGKMSCYQLKIKDRSTETEQVKRQAVNLLMENNFSQLSDIAASKEDQEKAVQNKRELIALQKEHPKLSIDEVIQLWSLRKQIKPYVINDPVQNEIREQLRAILRLENLRM